MSDLNHIVFDVREIPGGAHEVMPVVDGRDLVEIVGDYELSKGFSTAGSYAGLVPAYFRFGPLIDHYLGRGKWYEGAPAILGCDCHEWGCWPFHTEIKVGAAEVAWTGWRGPKEDRDYSGLPGFRFRRSDYEEAVRAVEVALTSDAES